MNSRSIQKLRHIKVIKIICVYEYLPNKAIKLAPFGRRRSKARAVYDRVMSSRED